MLVLGFFAVLGLQSLLHPFPETPLTGYEQQSPSPALNWETWSTSQWQSGREDRLMQQFGFRAGMVRLINQLRYSFFNEHTDVITKSADGTLFENAYRASICGEDYMGDSMVGVTIDSLDRFRNHLASLGKQMVILIAPNKWRTFAEKVDWECSPKKTNYAELIPKIRHRGYTVCDAIDVFIYDEAQHPDHPLHSKQGTHWSLFGASVVLDYVRYSFAEEGITLPKVYYDSIEVAKRPRGTDKDLHDLLNIMFGPAREEVAYPKLRYQDHPKPNVLVIGDSYYWTFYTLGAHQGLFAPESTFLYYNREIVASDPQQREVLDDAGRRKALDDADVVLLVMSEPSLAKFGYGILGLRL